MPISTVEESRQDISVSGDLNDIVQAGRDVVQYIQTIQVRDPSEQFFRLDLDNLEPAPEPRDLARIAEALTRRGLLVLGGAYEDKPGIARQVARRVAGGRGALEWQGGSEYGRLLQGLQLEKTPAVVLLPGLRPSDVANDLSRLHRAAERAGHAVVATSEQPRSAWRLEPGDDAFWYELDAAGLFDVEMLEAELAAQLGRIRTLLPDGAFDEAGPDAATLAGIALREIAARLGTPGSITVFVSQIAGRERRAVLTEAEVRALEAAAADPRLRIERWFHGLGHREQLLALGVSLFDGLYDDQLFAALDRWVRAIRTDRDPSLAAFDYAELDALGTFVRRVEAAGSAAKVTSFFPGQRRAVFAAAWNTRRRQLLAALPVLTEMVTESANGRRDWELLGSREHCRMLRRAVTDALADLGSISPEGIEPALVALASRRDADVQSVAAEALAAWRSDERGDGRLKAVLEQWQHEGRARAMLAATLESRDVRDRKSVGQHVRGTIALTVGFASLYDPPNQLDPGLVALIRNLADDDTRFVLDRVAGYTLPLAVSRHLRQLEPLLEELAANHSGLRAGIAGSLAFAYRTAPEEVAALLERWRSRAAARRPDVIDLTQVTRRDALLIVVALAFGAIDFSLPGPLAAPGAFARLAEILASERHPRVRSAVMKAVEEQADNRFEAVEPLIQSLLAGITPAECDAMVRLLTRTYLSQRAELSGGDDEIVIDGTAFPVWLQGQRQPTSVETALSRWVADSAHPAAQRLAFRTRLTFAEVFDAREKDQVERLRRARRRGIVVDNQPALMQARAPGLYAGTFVPWLATWNKRDLRIPVRTLLPDALAERTARPEALDFVLDDWAAFDDARVEGRLAGVLRGAMALSESAGAIVLMSVVFVTVVVVMAIVVHALRVGAG
jgi:hypothetical protein